MRFHEEVQKIHEEVQKMGVSPVGRNRNEADPLEHRFAIAPVVLLFWVEKFLSPLGAHYARRISLIVNGREDLRFFSSVFVLRKCMPCYDICYIFGPNGALRKSREHLVEAA